ncbi:hypothetical protein M446_5813 [Methylobacterium sp. 4-46]|uniref:hypothetical protein n=1 Tax=unclassified Methylobacterium TaxID=2615210 RepID=UPI000152CC53|nr:MULTISPECIES: hypothetical protein [Methylobacterium]ACA20100.1 hypothetical protein M446_5813 [Methylobacterium sp. 4-46]WFT79285.1 hypothetical protein QA634_29335 [Methylobacterium nodulans]
MTNRQHDLLDRGTVAEIEDLVLGGRGDVERRRMVQRLRQLESLSRQRMNDREELQLIMSARRLLGDRESFGVVRGLFAEDARRA